MFSFNRTVSGITILAESLTIVTIRTDGGDHVSTGSINLHQNVVVCGLLVIDEIHRKKRLLCRPRASYMMEEIL